MRVVLQRSKKSSVTIDGKVNGKIDSGFVLLVGFTEIGRASCRERV